jgi:hypothetical protein
MRIVTEKEFAERVRCMLVDMPDVGSVTGPGRSGSVAAVYASHILGVPYIPFKTSNVPSHLGKLLIIDTAMESGNTMRKAERFYSDVPHVSLAVYHEPPRVAFWYEAQKPQRYRHERQLAT